MLPRPQYFYNTFSFIRGKYLSHFFYLEVTYENCIFNLISHCSMTVFGFFYKSKVECVHLRECKRLNSELSRKNLN